MIEQKSELIIPPETRTYAYFRVAKPNKLIELQKKLPQQTQLQLVDPQTFHLTYIHFGKPTELYNDITKYTDISLKDFLEKFHRLLDTIESPLRIRALATSINTFGSFDNPKIAAFLELPEDAYIARELYLDWLDEEIISRKESWDSSAQSKIINWEPHSPYSDYQAHITIAQSDKPLLSPINFEIIPTKIMLDGIYIRR
jgi:hypothetical protein